jgi:transposase
LETNLVRRATSERAFKRHRQLYRSWFCRSQTSAGGQVIVRRQLKRRYVLAFFQKVPPCLVGIEACGSAHHWSRELQALALSDMPGRRDDVCS